MSSETVPSNRTWDALHYRVVRDARSPRPENWAGLWGAEVDKAKWYFVPMLPGRLIGTQSYWKNRRHITRFMHRNHVDGFICRIPAEENSA